METNQAEENLKVIRTIMERAAIYRRRLGPIMLVPGVVGTALGVGGCGGGMNDPFTFTCSWLAAAVLTLLICLMVSRLQAKGAGEKVFSPSAQRVVMATVPSLVAGMVLTVPYLFFMKLNQDADSSPAYAFMSTILSVPVWLALYGTALNAAGQYSSRGVTILGWGFILSASVMISHIAATGGVWAYTLGHSKIWWEQKAFIDLNLIMAITFGGYHLIAAAYLFATEKRGSST